MGTRCFDPICSENYPENLEFSPIKKDEKTHKNVIAGDSNSRMLTLVRKNNMKGMSWQQFEPMTYSCPPPLQTTRYFSACYTFSITHRSHFQLALNEPVFHHY